MSMVVRTPVQGIRIDGKGKRMSVAQVGRIREPGFDVILLLKYELPV